MKIAFVGLGSIGIRHLNNVYKYLSEKGEAFEVDAFRSGKGKELPKEVTTLLTNVYFEEPDTVNKQYDAVFVTNPSSKHLETMEKFFDYTKTFFVEKPVFDTTEVDRATVEKFSQKLCYVACPLRYNPVLEYVAKNIDLSKVISAKAISSSYLPDWRPGTDYRKCYSAHKDMGGGVHLDLIHEWDYLTNFFGYVKEGFSIIDKVSNLEIDSADCAIYIAKTEKALIELHLDYFGRKTLRELTLFTENDTIECDIQNGRVSFLKSGKEEKLVFERNDFQMKEIRHFFDIVAGKTENDNSVYHAMKVLEYARGEF